MSRDLSMNDLDAADDGDDFLASSSTPAAPARLRARIMASGYRYQMLGEREELDLVLKEETANTDKAAARLKRVIVLLGLVSLALLVALVFVIARQSSQRENAIVALPCTTLECVGTSAAILSKMDHSVSPCQNMYQRACGGWVKNAIPAPGVSSWTIFAQVQQDSEAKIRQLVETEGNEVKGQNSTAVDKMKRYYKTCMDVDTIEAQGTTRLLELMSKLGFWTVSPAPVDQSAWDADRWSLQKALVNFHKLSRASLFEILVSKDPKVEHKNILIFSQSGLTLAHEDEYVDPSDKFKDGYMAFAEKVGVLLGGNLEDVRTKMAAVYEFEKNMSKIFVPRQELQDPLTFYQKYNIADFQKLLGDWVDIKTYLQDTFYGKEFNDSTEVYVVTTDYFSKLGELVEATDKETLANYMMWEMIQSMTGYLPEAFSRAVLELLRVENGVSSLPERWKSCLKHAQSAVGLAGSALYVEKYFSQTSKIQVESALEQVKRQFMSNLEEVKWLDDVTRSRLKVKAKAMALMVGYPDWILEAEKLDERFEKLQVTDGEFFTNKLYAIAYGLNRSLEELDKEPDPTEWDMLPDAVNAYYHPDYNQVVVPAGILQPPIYSPHYPDALLYGTIGVVIGHELTHGFDNAGREHNEHGLLRDMWTPQAERGFKEAATCMREQYSGYSLHGIQVDGNLTLGENIADNGGVKMAYRAFLANGGSPRNTSLPGLNVTDTQLFFLGFSQIWCSVVKPEEVHALIKTDVHSPGQFRVKGVLSNTPDFSSAFGCETDSPLNPSNKCHIW